MTQNKISELQLLLLDEIFQINADYEKDIRAEKINGGIGVYFDETGRAYVHSAVKEAIKFLNFTNFNYLPISGDSSFLDETAKILLTDQIFLKNKDRIAKQGVIGGTNGIYIWCNLIKKINSRPKIIMSLPTWENNIKIFSYMGFEIITCPHLIDDERFDFQSFAKVISENPDAYILVHGGPTHNPTGINPSKDEWIKTADLIKQTGNGVLFDFAYMGLGDDISEDCFPIRFFLEKNIETSVVLSFSKNMTLYQHRAGALFIATPSKKEKDITESHLKSIFRIVNSNPAAFGELIAKTIFESRELKKMWIADLADMASSLKKRRRLFSENAGQKYKNIPDQKGLFSLLNLKSGQIDALKKKYAIYLLSNSRINFGGLSIKNIPYLAKIIKKL